MIDENGAGHGTATRSPGHLFLVHGRIESVVHDVAIIPTSDAFHLRRYWGPVLGGHYGRWKPREWPGRGYARATGRDDVWFISVGARTGLSPEDLVGRLRAALDEVAQASVSPHRNRLKPLVAVPILGIEGGGHGADRGNLIRAILVTLSEAVRNLGIDVVVVTPDPSVYAAAQHLRRMMPATDIADDELRKAKELGKLARDGELALFIGAGVSVPAGLPSWHQLIERLVEDEGTIDDVDLTRLTPLDQAQVLEHRLPDHSLGRRVADIVNEHQRPALGHALLAGLGCREAVTTNYDRLYERAVEATGREATTILPWKSGVGADSWILKMHGDVENPKSIVLTRRHFVRFDANTRPAGAMLQTLLLTRHLLLVGASLTDDNVVRLMLEVEAYREDHKVSGRLGTLLDVEHDDSRSELWRDQLSWIDMPGRDINESSRALEIFLDTMATFATDDASWLLDRRFEALLSEQERGLAKKARELQADLRGSGNSWRQLVDALGALGGGSAAVQRK